jgi:GntR family transcriptional regulator
VSTGGQASERKSFSSWAVGLGGAVAVGGEFPGELALAAAYQVSRQTVRTALRELRADGVVIAERGRRPRITGRALISQPLGAPRPSGGMAQAPDHRAPGVTERGTCDLTRRPRW